MSDFVANLVNKGKLSEAEEKLSNANMVQKPFVRYHEDKKVDSVSVRFNEKERTDLELAKLVINQTKDSTALKTLAWIGINVLHDSKVSYILETLFKNKKNNGRTGINNFD